MNYIMIYNIYAHHSKNAVGYFVEDSTGKVILSDYTKGEYSGYTEPLLSAIIACIKAIPGNSPVAIHCPMIGTITTNNGVKRALSLRVEMQRLLSARNVKYVRANEDDYKIRRAKSLVPCAKGTHKTSKGHHSAYGQTDFIPDYIAYTDGSCNNLSPYGEGGAAYVILDGQRNLVKQNSKGFVGVTNNRMELMAILSAVAAVPSGSTLAIYTDSQYCIQVLTNKANANNFSRPNANIIRQYFNYASRLKAVRFEWVKGHDGNEFNEMVDALAQSRTEEIRTIHNIPVYDYRNSPKCKK